MPSLSWLLAHHYRISVKSGVVLQLCTTVPTRSAPALLPPPPCPNRIPLTRRPKS